MSDRSIREAIQHLAGTNRKDDCSCVDAEVLSYDKGGRNCSVKLITGKSGSTIDNVRLMPEVDDGILILPTVGSTVTILITTFGEPTVVGYSEVDEIIFRGGDLGGLVKLLEALKSFNRIEEDINNLKQLFSSWTPIPNDGGAALKSAVAPWLSQQLPVTKRTDLENEKITQG